MTSEAEIESVRFTKSVIKSSAALSYIEAQARMDDRFFCSIPFFIFTAFNIQIHDHMFLDVAIFRLFWFFCTSLSSVMIVGTTIFEPIDFFPCEHLAVVWRTG